METLEKIIYSIILIGLILIFSILIIESFINKLSDTNIIKKWWKRNVIDNDPYE
jgi:hypothetical protein